jgi:hypothetical protein
MRDGGVHRIAQMGDQCEFSKRLVEERLVAGLDICLASAVAGWLRWGWQDMNTGGGWRRRPPRVPAPEGEATEVGEAP